MFFIMACVGGLVLSYPSSEMNKPNGLAIIYSKLRREMSVWKRTQKKKRALRMKVILHHGHLTDKVFQILSCTFKIEASLRYKT